MQESAMTALLFQIFWHSAVLVVPPLVVSTVLALVIAIIQAVTQIQEQTLGQTVKLFVISLMLLAMGPALASPFYQLAEEIISSPATYAY